jgi:hypothetical protein
LLDLAPADYFLFQKVEELAGIGVTLKSPKKIWDGVI